MIKKFPPEEPEFQINNGQLLLHRLKIVSIALICYYGFCLFVDLVLFSNLEDDRYRMNLALIHTSLFLISLIYLLLYPKLKHLYRTKPKKYCKICSIVIICYITLYLVLGMLTSVNSQRLTGNIDAYIIGLIGAAAIFPIRPKSFFFILLGNYTAFILLLLIFSQNTQFLVTKFINITGATGIAFIVIWMFYSYRRNDFANQVKLKKQEEHFRQLFEINPYPLILATLDDKILLINHAAKDYFAISHQGQNPFDVTNLYKTAADKQYIIETLQTEGSVRNYIVEHSTAAGPKWSMVNYELFEYDDTLCVLAGITDITKLKEAEKELLSHATFDVLTGIMNRRSGMEALRETLIQVKEKKQSLILCFIDINHLKQVNDQYGHLEGDRLIKSVCDVIKQSITPPNLLFRYGGDEFIVAFPGHTRESVDALWGAILQSIEKLNQIQNLPYEVSISRGCHEYASDDDYTLEQLVNLADIEMYKEKLHLKNRTL